MRKNQGQVGIECYLGAEIYVDSEDDESIESIINKLDNGRYPTLNGTKYVLIEFYLGGFEMSEVVPAVSKLIDGGYIPVVAHAEKYGLTIDDIQILKKMGCCIQMNLCDVLDHWSDDTVAMANGLMESRMVDFIGTDAHRIEWRPPQIAKYATFLQKHYSQEYVRDVLHDNAANTILKEILQSSQSLNHKS